MPTTGDIGLDIKYIFVSFAQKYFAQHAKYTWDIDPRLTSIIIADKNAIDLGVTVRRPSIIISRGPFTFLKMGISQRVAPPNVTRDTAIETLKGPLGSADRVATATYLDLVKGSVTYTVVSKFGLEAESIANELLTALVGYQEDIRAKGILKLERISLGNESLLKHGADIELLAVPIDFSYTKNVRIMRGEKQNNCRVYLDTTETLEGIHFRVDTDGTQIIFETAPATGVVPRITYVHAISLATITLALLVGTVDGTNKTFTVPDSGVIYGYYTLFEDHLLTQNVEDPEIL